MNTSNKTEGAIVDRAITILEESGWTKGRYINQEGQCCLLGSLSLAAAGLSPQEVLEHYGDVPEDGDFEGLMENTQHQQNTNRVYNRVCKYIQSAAGGPSLHGWNDSHTEKEVLALLRKASFRFQPSTINHSIKTVL